MATAGEIINRIAADCAAEMTLALRDHLLSCGWPQNVVDGVSVISSPDDDFKIDIEKPHRDAAFDLEHGTEESVPTFGLHRFKTEMMEPFEEKFCAEALTALFEGGIL